MYMILPFNKCIAWNIFKGENANLSFQVWSGRPCSIANPGNLLIFCVHFSNYQMFLQTPSQMSNKDTFKVLDGILTTHVPLLVMDHCRLNSRVVFKNSHC